MTGCLQVVKGMTVSTRINSSVLNRRPCASVQIVDDCTYSFGIMCQNICSSLEGMRNSNLLYNYNVIVQRFEPIVEN